MPDIVNPYIPGQPADDPSLFFGRRDVASAIREGLVKGRRVFLVSGAERIGKTSLLLQLPAYLPEEFVAVLVELWDEDIQRLDRLLWRLADSIRRQVNPRVREKISEPPWTAFEAHTGRLLDDFWPQVRAALGDQILVLMIDDLDCLADSGDLLDRLIAILGTWRDQDAAVAIVATSNVVQQGPLTRHYPHLFGGAQTCILGPLASEEANRLVTWPAEGVLVYDYGVARRLIEVTSGQPYYLQLLCFEIFNRCAPAGWVNQRDLDVVMEDLVSRDIADFRQVWEESSPQEQAVLAALVSLRGARGVATVREVRTILTKAGARVEQEPVVSALDSLVNRGILERLGALSYRFRVAMLRDWLAERIDLGEVVRDTRWAISGRGKPSEDRRVSKLRGRKERRRAEARPRREPAAVDEGEEEEPARRGLPWLRIAAGVLGLIVVIMIAAAVLNPAPPVPDPTATPSASATVRLARVTLTSAPVATDRPAALASPTEGPTPLPTLSPSPTPPLVIARSVPAIAYQALAEGEARFSLYVMSSDGSDRTRLADGQSGFLSAPSWSPDGSMVAFASDMDGNADIWVMNSDGTDLVNLTSHESKDHSPAWSPDGAWIAFASVRDSAYWELYLMRADGSDVQRLTWWEDASDLSPSWSPDGTRLAFASKRDGNWEIYIMDREGGNLVRLTDDPADDTDPAWSPDGGRIAFASTRDGYAEIYVRPLGSGEAVNISNAPYSTERGPTWSPDGGRIAFYSDRDGDWDIYVMGADGSDPVKLTGDSTNDQVPAWRP